MERMEDSKDGFWQGCQVLRKFTKLILKYHKMLYVLLKFSQNRPKKILFSSRLKKAKKKAKRPNHFICRKLFQKRPNGNPGFWQRQRVTFHEKLLFTHPEPLKNE
jgi:hypothetical protein